MEKHRSGQPRFVVLTGASRSGTTFASRLLSLAPNAAVAHERIGDRDFFCISAISPSHPFIRSEIRNGFARVRATHPDKVNVEVNSSLCFAVEAVKELVPDVMMFHLVRNPREVITSNWRRKMYTSYAKGIDVTPSTNAGMEVFERYDRFQKLAWQWNRIVSPLLEVGFPVIHMERIVRDYDYLSETLLRPAGIELNYEQWASLKEKKVNGSRVKLWNIVRKRDRVLEWTDLRERQLKAICGRTMQALNYA
jgi:hypothetical protein